MQVTITESHTRLTYRNRAVHACLWNTATSVWGSQLFQCPPLPPVNQTIASLNNAGQLHVCVPSVVG